MIIGITGQPPAGSGKDTVADFLVEEYGFAKVAMADPMKRICKEVFDFSDEQLWGPSENRNKGDLRYFRDLTEKEFDALPPPRDFFLVCAKCYYEIGDFEKHDTKCDEEEVECTGKTMEEVKLDREKNIQEMMAERGGNPPCASCGYALKEGAIHYLSAECHTSVVLTPRYALQQLGHEWARMCYPDTWVNYCMRMAEGLLANRYCYDRSRGKVTMGGTNIQERLAKGVVVPDVRYDNEARAIRKAGGKIWLVSRPGAGLKGDAAKHASEVGVGKENIDFCIKNNRGFGWLHQQIRTLMSGKEVRT